MTLHSLTAMLLILIGNTITGLGLHAISRGHLGKVRGISRWAEATLLQAVGWLLVGPLRPLVGNIVSIAGGYALLALSVGLYLIILGDFNDRPVKKAPVYAAVVFQTVVLTYFVVVPDMNMRLMIATPVSGVLLLLAGRVILLGPSRRHASDRFTATVFLATGGFLVLRGVYEVATRLAPEVVPAEWRATWDNLTFLNFFVVGTLVSFGFLLMVTDRYLTERDEASRALETSLKEKESLLRETHHRVKNNLSLIASLMRVTAHDSGAPETRAVLKDMQARLQSVVLLNETLYRTASYSEVDLGAYLRKIATHVVSAHGAGRVRLSLDLGTAEVATAHAIPCGLIVNELMTNSMKHAFGDGKPGEISVSLHASADGSLAIRVKDSGPGLGADFAAMALTSFGLQLVSELTRQLQGTIEAGPGSAFTLTFTPRRRESADSTLPPGMLRV